MNAVLMLTRNNLEITKRAIASVLAQDIPTDLIVIDNDSSDGTKDWLVGEEGKGTLRAIYRESNQGVSAGWNHGIEAFFRCDKPPVEHVLVLNNDVELAPWFYRELLAYAWPFITGVAVNDRSAIEGPAPPPQPLQPHPDFSAFLIYRDVWNLLGKFDERMVNHASDCDYHVRGHRRGVPMAKANVPYYHVGSATMRLAHPKERRAIAKRADDDRDVFRSIYGCIPGEPGYDRLFHDEG